MNAGRNVFWVVVVLGLTMGGLINQKELSWGERGVALAAMLGAVVFAIWILDRRDKKRAKIKEAKDEARFAELHRKIQTRPEFPEKNP